MKKYSFIGLLLLTTLCISSVKPLHKANIEIVSPTANQSVKTGETINIKAIANCEEALLSATISIVDAATDKILFTASPNVKGKFKTDLNAAWKVSVTDPSVLTLTIAVRDGDGHGSSKMLQFNANF